MLKRRIAVLIAGVFIGTQVGMAAEDQETFSAADNDQYVTPETTQNGPAPSDVAEISSPVVAYAEPAVDIGPPVVTNPTGPVARIDAVPPSADDMVWTPLPAQAKYLEERAARMQTAVRGDVFPPSASDTFWTPLPAQARYFEERAARTQTALRGDVFPPSADELAGRLLPSQVSYFDRKAARTNVSVYGSPFSGSIE